MGRPPWRRFSIAQRRSTTTVNSDVAGVYRTEGAARPVALPQLNSHANQQGDDLAPRQSPPPLTHTNHSRTLPGRRIAAPQFTGAGLFSTSLADYPALFALICPQNRR